MGFDGFDGFVLLNAVYDITLVMTTTRIEFICRVERFNVIGKIGVTLDRETCW